MIRKGALVNVLEKVWKLKEPAEFLKVEKDVLLLKLMKQEDPAKVLEGGGPWSLKGDAILLQKWEPGMNGEDFVNSSINTYELRSDYAELLASYVGRVKAQTKDKGVRKPSYEGEYMKCRIELDTQKPTLPGMFLKRIGRKSVWVSLKYERLPHVCYYCRRLNHDTKVCKENNAKRERSFGGWLKAEEQTRWAPRWSEEELDENILVVEMAQERACNEGSRR